MKRTIAFLMLAMSACATAVRVDHDAAPPPCPPNALCNASGECFADGVQCEPQRGSNGSDDEPN